jgi:hypothetical protein
VKQCKKCLINLPLDMYHVKSDAIDGLRTACKSCRSEERKQRYALNKEHEKAICKQYAKNNINKVALKNKLWAQKNKQYIALREKEKRHNNINYKLIGNLRKRLNHALNKNQKSGSAIDELGCSIEELKIYLESKFEPWMTWDNYGKFDPNRKTWNIDHIKPLALFNLSDLSQMREASHYSNLQPILAKTNFSKGAKYNES